MKAGEVIRAVYNACNLNREEVEARAEMAGILRECGWHVVETDSDLRDLALEVTDLTQPE